MSLPPLIESLYRNDYPHPSTDIATLHQNPKRVKSTPPKSSTRLELPIPDYDDYFELRGDGLPGDFDGIPMETSKGCWWAEAGQCSFCGLNGANLQFRSKSPDDALNEFLALLERYRPTIVEMNDLIIPTKYFSSFFIALSKINHGVTIFYETKAHLNFEQLSLLKKAGVTKIQAGIESLSDNTLKRMSKGVSAERNLQFLADCNTLDIACYWNYLHSFPDETGEDMLAAEPFIRNSFGFQAPATFQCVRVERFSPFFENPKAYGIDHYYPNRFYKHLYRGSYLDCDKLAFYFDHTERQVNTVSRNRAIRVLGDLISDWQCASSNRIQYIQ
jgi:ribosomal peptide maturation radical SAM protein 1